MITLGFTLLMRSCTARHACSTARDMYMLTWMVGLMCIALLLFYQAKPHYCVHLSRTASNCHIDIRVTCLQNFCQIGNWFAEQQRQHPTHHGGIPREHHGEDANLTNAPTNQLCVL
eukprot:GHRR01015309.1.p2 GENE.GHRR01015309.1~~GHRR01015309.1.p2  ORF type:complete len:116 (-),score=15.50 GHRR01015309.1:756-1103(-)